MVTPVRESTRALWRVELFGPLRARGCGETIDRYPTQMTAGLLAFLAFYPDRRHAREEIIDILWPEADLPSGRDRLSQALVWIRHHLEPTGVPRGTVLRTDKLSVALSPAAITTDVAEFVTAVQRSRNAEATTDKIQALIRAAALYRGELLSGLHSDWILTERRRLLDAYLIDLRQLIALLEQERDYDRALDYARRAVAADPLQEEAHCDLMRVLATAGKTAAAFRQFGELKRLLARDLDAEPSTAAIELVDRIRADSQRAIPMPSSPQPPALPTPLTRFFGREAEIDRLLRLAQSDGVRLIALLGVGGTGKTRLALEAAARFAAGFAGFVAFVPLADLADPQMVPAAIAGSLRLPRSVEEPPIEQIVRALSAGPCLLVLDNLEHLLTGAAPLARELLQRVPGLTLVVTTRQRLSVEGEHVLSVPPLSVPHLPSTPEELLASESVQLFVDRARSVSPDLALTPVNAAAIARLCERLDGIPLAIELCAAWASMLTPTQMLEKLDRRFDLLVSRRVDIPPRHRTLRAALESSFVQLPPDLQRLYARLSVFRGGWTLESAAAVCCEGAERDQLSVLVGLTELRERSLLLAEEVGAGEHAEMRYRMLETLREFTGEQLAPEDLETLRHAHAGYYLALAERADVEIAGPEQKNWLARLDMEQENLRTALTWCLETQDVVTGLRLGGALGGYWTIRGFLQEGIDWMRRLLDAAAPPHAGALSLDPGTKAKALNTFGHLAWSRSDYATARSAHEEALVLRRQSGDRRGEAESLYHLAITAYRLEDYPGARELLDQSLAVAGEQGDRAGIARVLLNLGNLAYEQARYDEARDLLYQSLTIEQELGNNQRVANALNNVALVATAEKDYRLAEALFRDALSMMEELTDYYGTAIALANLGDVVRLQGDHERAWALLSEGAQLAHRIGNKHILGYCFLRLGLLAFTLKWFGLCVHMLTTAMSVQRVVGGTFSVADAAQCEQAIRSARLQMGETAFVEALADAESGSPEHAVALALASWKRDDSTPVQKKPSDRSHLH
jgi:predicted ATPase/DNA-binding SARP family transcriptional activator